MSSLNCPRTVIAVFAAVALAGCFGKPALPPILQAEPKPDPTVVSLEISADAAVNPDARGRAMPIVLRYYVLQNTAAFDSADFFSLFERDEAVLGAAKLVREEITLRPGQTSTTVLRPQGEAKFIAVFGAYRDINKSGWRATAAIPQNKSTAYKVRIGPQAISISPPSP
jgi:type VI secretion system protein VasD